MRCKATGVGPIGPIGPMGPMSPMPLALPAVGLFRLERFHGFSRCQIFPHQAGKGRSIPIGAKDRTSPARSKAGKTTRAAGPRGTARTTAIAAADALLEHLELLLLIVRQQ